MDEDRCFSICLEVFLSLVLSIIVGVVCFAVMDEKQEKNVRALQWTLDSQRRDLNRFDGIRQTQINDVNSKINDMGRKIRDLEAALVRATDVSSQLQSKQSEVVTELHRASKMIQELEAALTHVEDFSKHLEDKQKEDFNELKALATIPTVLFRATRVERMEFESGIVIFSNASTNIGTAYDEATGYFTVPVTGTYLFNAEICPKQTKWIEVRIMTDDEAIGRVNHYDEIVSGICSSNVAVASLKMGQKVWLRCAYSYSTALLMDTATKFSGVLLHF